MEQTDRELLERTFELARENNHMLHAQRRAAFVGGIIKFVVWFLLLIVIPYYFYVIYMKPYLGEIMNAYQNVQGAADKAQALQGSFKLPSDLPPGLVDFFKNLQEQASGQ